MRSLITTIPLLIVVVTLLYTLIRHIGRVWLEHRVKMELLNRLEERPELLRSFDDLKDLVEGGTSDPENSFQLDFTMTGVILAVIGILCVVLYATVGSGRWAVGAYWGGVVCVVLGFLMALVGWLLHFITRPRNGAVLPNDEPRRR